MCSRCNNQEWCICQEHEKCALFVKSRNCICCECQVYIKEKHKESRSTEKYRKIISKFTTDLVEFYKRETSYLEGQ